MSTDNKRLDIILAIVGIIVSIIAGFDIIGAFENFFTNDIVKYFNFFLGISVLVIVILKKSSVKTDYHRMDPEKIPKYLTSSKIISKYNKVAIYNPHEVTSISMLIEFFNTNGLGISIIGEANDLLNIFNSLNSDKLVSLSKFFHVLSFGQESSIILLYNDNSHDLSLTYSNERSAFNIIIKDKELANDINKILHNRDELYKKSIKLDQISKPSDFLDVINREKERYVNNFKNLKSGYISFYGTEVLNVQSGWIESGNFKTIKTLDLTSDPGILLTRHRYIEANRKFIKSGGIVKRVYLIERNKLEDSVFNNNLKSAIRLQKELGAEIGLQFLDDLQPKQKQDFILYDSFASLVEEKQANSDYSFGKSTAYFSTNKLNEYEKIFNDIWNGLGLQYSAKENLSNYINI